MTKIDDQIKQVIENRFNENNKIFHERNEKVTKKIDQRKERNLDFYHQVKISCLFSLFHRKKLTCDQKSGKNDVTQVTA